MPDIDYRQEIKKISKYMRTGACDYFPNICLLGILDLLLRARYTKTYFITHK